MLNRNRKRTTITNIEFDEREAKPEWGIIFGTFFIEFILSQLVLTYGIYGVHLTAKEQVSLHYILWNPLIFIVIGKIFNMRLRELVDTYCENYSRTMFVLSIITCSVGVSLNYFTDSHVLQGLLFGFLGGLGSSLTLCIVQEKIFDVFQYQTTIIRSIHHISLALGLFITPHIINLFFVCFGSSRYVFLYHGLVILHSLPAALLFGGRKPSIIEVGAKIPHATYESKTLDATNREIKMIIMKNNNVFSNAHEMQNINKSQSASSLSRMWRNPADYSNPGLVDDQIQSVLAKSPSGVNIMPKIVEEDEENCEDNNSALSKDIKRLSVISSRLEEIITNEGDANEGETGSIQSNGIEFRNPTRRNLGCCCISQHQRYRCRRRLKSFAHSIIDRTLKPLVISLRVFEFYPCLIASVHSSFSPAVFFIFSVLKAKQIKDVHTHELSFMVSITAFAYICFLITLPWISDISKKNLRYLYICGLTTSAIGVYMFKKTGAHDYMTVSCLIYGFGFGIEMYCRDIVLKEHLGVKNWPKVEGTLDCLSGMFLVGIIAVINNSVSDENYIKFLFDMIYYSHVCVALVWIFSPLITFLYNIYNERRRERYSFMEVTN